MVSSEPSEIGETISQRATVRDRQIPAIFPDGAANSPSKIPNGFRASRAKLARPSRSAQLRAMVKSQQFSRTVQPSLPTF
jgi:hypothetical protein